MSWNCRDSTVSLQDPQAAGVILAYTLEAVGRLGLLADDIENRVDELSSFGVVPFGPIVSSSALTKNKVVGACASESAACPPTHVGSLTYGKDLREGQP